MRIGIVLHPYGEDQPAGLARTIFEFTRGLLELNNTGDEYLIFLKNELKKNLDLLGKNWQVIVLGGGLFWLEKLRRAPAADVYLFNTPVMPLFFKPKKSIIIALDFWYVLYRPASIKGHFIKWFTFLYHWFSLRRADKIIAISRATKNDVCRLFHIPKEKVQVVYCGFKKICHLPEQEISLPPRFLLFTGVIKERKNVFNIVRAFYKFQKIIPDYFLVIGGHARGNYAERIKRYIEEKKIGDKVIWLGHLNDNELSFVYKRATCLVFPTLIEGFGFPVLEAMDCGVPVITSNCSSLAEVGGDAALLVDPYDDGAIAQAMQLIVKNVVLRRSLIEKGRKHSQKFSWQKAAVELYQVFLSL